MYCLGRKFTSSKTTKLPFNQLLNCQTLHARQAFYPIFNHVNFLDNASNHSIAWSSKFFRLHIFQMILKFEWNSSLCFPWYTLYPYIQFFSDLKPFRLVETQLFDSKFLIWNTFPQSICYVSRLFSYNLLNHCHICIGSNKSIYSTSNL